MYRFHYNIIINPPTSIKAEGTSLERPSLFFYGLCKNDLHAYKLGRRRLDEWESNHSHSTNPIIWGCIFYAFTGATFANLLIFHLLFLAANFLSIKIVSQKAGEYNYLLHRFPGYSAIENTLIYRKFSFIALDAFRSGRSRHPWTL